MCRTRSLSPGTFEFRHPRESAKRLLRGGGWVERVYMPQTGPPQKERPKNNNKSEEVREREEQWSCRRLMTTLARAPDTHTYTQTLPLEKRTVRRWEPPLSEGVPRHLPLSPSGTTYPLAQSPIWQSAQLKKYVTMKSRQETKCN